jgi:hypothetical protein
MATRGLESRFERMSVHDENDSGDVAKTYKSKVSKSISSVYYRIDIDRIQLRLRSLPTQAHNYPRQPIEPTS